MSFKQKKEISIITFCRIPNLTVEMIINFSNNKVKCGHKITLKSSRRSIKAHSVKRNYKNKLILMESSFSIIKTHTTYMTLNQMWIVPLKTFIKQSRLSMKQLLEIKFLFIICQSSITCFLLFWF